ncbi:hypothetical protein L195_g007071 [Trifolium pratense]|uniref:Uncharacterized protein n=1 Tax=Trifolium pratense TaxID=57577 RepID=A0A2K3MK91_TRIPR|nr:hypothetical protein L195_g030543 [Trifolium pratense]PNX91184.1 hypothetical protein L195_g047314 [Trifolium pratense]PNY10492.1 hypothetical protein L195_g007071 [Trifolium pratense]
MAAGCCYLLYDVATGTVAQPKRLDLEPAPSYLAQSHQISTAVQMKWLEWLTVQLTQPRQK